MDVIPDLLIPRQIDNNERKKKRKRRKRIGARQRKKLRFENPEALIVRLEKECVRRTQLRLNETSEKRDARLEGDRRRRRLSTQCKEGPKYEQMLQRKREYVAKTRRNETREKREARRERERRYAVQKRLNEDPEEKRIRRARARIREAEARLNEDPEKRRMRLEQNRIYAAEKRRNENPEERAIRLKRAREYIYRQRRKLDQDYAKARLEIHDNGREYFDEARGRAELIPDCRTEAEQNIDFEKEKALSEHGLSNTFDECPLNIITPQTHHLLFMTTLLPESKPSHEHLNEIKHETQFTVNNLHTNIKTEYSEYDIIDNFREECTEIIIPDAVDAKIKYQDAIEELSSMKIEQSATQIKEEISITDT